MKKLLTLIVLVAASALHADIGWRTDKFGDRARAGREIVGQRPQVFTANSPQPAGIEPAVEQREVVAYDYGPQPVLVEEPMYVEEGFVRPVGPVTGAVDVAAGILEAPAIAVDNMLGGMVGQ